MSKNLALLFLCSALQATCQIAPSGYPPTSDAGAPMSTAENGLPSNISSNLPASVNITSSTNANPVVMQTSTPHGMTNGDYVDVEGHQTNTIANGQFQATVIDSTHFSIPVTGNGVGGATGTVQPLALGPTFAIPADGVDNEAAASVNTPFEALADRTAWLGLMTGAYKIAAVSAQFANQSESNTAYAQNTGVTNSYVVATPLGGGTPSVAVTGAMTGDLLLVSYTLTVAVPTTGTPTNSWVALMSATTVPGGSIGSYSKIAGSNQGVTPGNTATPITLRGRLIVGGPSAFGSTFNFSPGFYCNGGTGGTFSLLGDAYVEVTILRPTGKPQ